jgi:hypothetical protein
MHPCLLRGEGMERGLGAEETCRGWDSTPLERERN